MKISISLEIFKILKFFKIWALRAIGGEEVFNLYLGPSGTVIRRTQEGCIMVS